MGLTSPGLRASPPAGQGLAYRPMSPWRQAGAGGLQGLGALLMALGSGQPQNAAAAFQGGLQGADEAEWRRQEQARRDEEFAYRQQERADAQAERERQRAERDAAKAKFGEFSARFSDDDPTNDPTSLQELLPYLDPDQGYGVAAEFLKPQEVKPNPSRTRNEGGQEIFEEFDPTTKTWNPVSSGPRWSPQQPAAGPKPPSAAELRGEYIKATKDYEQAAYGYGKVVSAASDPSPAGDIALIFGFMKTLDPNSTVREGEFATAQNAGSVPERIASLYNSVVQGTRLTETQRKDFINQAKGQFSVYEDRKKVADQFYTGLSERNEINPIDVLVPYGEPPRYLPSPALGPDERTEIIDGLKIRKVQ